MNKWLFRIHRWVGAVVGLFFLMWCLSGLVLVYHPFPNVDERDLQARMEPLPDSLPTVDSVAQRLPEGAAAKVRTVTVTPKYLEEQGGYYTGIVSAGSTPVKDPLSLVYYAAGEVKLNIRMAIQSVRMLVKGAVSPKNLTGPVGIVQAISDNMDAARPYGLRAVLLSLLSFGLLLSANLGVMNLLPLPALDGGRALLTAVEAVIRRPLNRKIEAMVHTAGFALLMGLMLYVLWNDVMRIVQHTGF